MKKERLIKKLIYLLLIFFVGSIVGWIYEMIFYWFNEGAFVNRGALFGPWLPIYGVGAVGLYFLKPLKKHPILIFLASVIVTGVVEYIIGFIGREVFDMKLWDYTGEFLNINGIVCFRSVISFGIAALFFHYILEPFMAKKYDHLNKTWMYIISGGLIAVLVIDTIFSVLYRKPPLY